MDPVYLILGDQAYLAQQVKDIFIDLIPDTERSMNIGSYDMEDVSVSAAVEDAISVPFLVKGALSSSTVPIF